MEDDFHDLSSVMGHGSSRNVNRQTLQSGGQTAMVFFVPIDDPVIFRNQRCSVITLHRKKPYYEQQKQLSSDPGRR